ncbi:MAG: VOC family protein [Myxococcaceae bacterium]
MRLNYIIKFVSDMNRAVVFYRDVLGLPLKFESPGWSEFATGDTILALHPASAHALPGAVELGFTVANIEEFHRNMVSKGVQFSTPPTKQDFGGLLAQFADSEGGHCSVSEQQDVQG